MSKVICNKKGKALYCEECLHGKPHYPFFWQDKTDCMYKSKCSVIEKVCKCIEIIELKENERNLSNTNG